MSKKTLGRRRFFISTIIGLVAIGLVAVFFYFPQQREATKFVAAVMGGSSAIYSAYYVGLGLRSRLEEDRRHRAFEFLALLNRPEFIKVRKFIEEEIQNPDQVAEKDLYSTVVSNFGLHVAIREVLGTFEDMALAIQFEHFDEDVLHRSVSVISDRHYVHLAFYIRQHRLEFDSPKLFCEFEALCNSWRKGRRLSDGKSF